ncbi:vascular endothelial growth factor receptor 3 [Salminus brasiliensis]|uniref:vascular endothelial growth factor receptor 3 n=1 Tax=Salminus brasiliensis TaxID=930266 RepID=UPI003B832E24
MKACVILATVVFAFLRNGNASLVVKGPTGPVVEGEEVTLECVDSESEFNMSSVHFEKLSRHMKKWHRLDLDDFNYLYRRCFYYDVNVKREDGRLLLVLPRIQLWSAGPYRCVADNATDMMNNSSVTYTIPVHYMREVSVFRDGLTSFTRYFNSLQELRVKLGDDVELECSTSASETPQYFWSKEGDDWIVPSSKLRLEQVRDLDSGKYTCTAQHPTVESLSKKRTISITVLPEDAAWYETTTGRIALMASAAGVALLVIIVSTTACLCRRTKQNKGKGPIDDRSQKKPIYRNSVESLTSTAGDKQPLV